MTDDRTWIAKNLRAIIAVGSIGAFLWYVWPPLILLWVGVAALAGEIVDWSQRR